MRVRTLVSKAKFCATRQPVFPCQSSHKTSCKRRRHETEFYARQASILLGNNAFRSGNDRSPPLKAFFALSRGRRGTQRAFNSVSCLLLFKKAQGMKLGRPTGPGKSKLDPYRPEIEGLLANGSTQKFIARRYRTTQANLHHWLKKRGLKPSQPRLNA